MTRTRMAVAAAAVVALSALGAGCNRPHVPSLSNGGVSTCYRAIPTAYGAVREPKAKLIGVHRMSADEVTSRLSPGDRALVDRSSAGTTIDNDTTVCAVALRGSFAAGQVPTAWAGTSGTYAVVLVTSHKLQILATFLANQLPRRLAGRFA